MPAGAVALQLSLPLNKPGVWWNEHKGETTSRYRYLMRVGLVALWSHTPERTAVRQKKNQLTHTRRSSCLAVALPLNKLGVWWNEPKGETTSRYRYLMRVGLVALWSHTPERTAVRQKKKQQTHTRRSSCLALKELRAEPIWDYLLLLSACVWNLNVTVVPAPFSLSTIISPPWSRTILSAIVSPRPAPSNLVV